MIQIIGTGGSLILKHMKQTQRLLVIPSREKISREKIIDTIRL